MEVKRDILWRVYLSYLLMILVCVVIFGKAIFIQQVEGNKWRSMSDSLHQRIQEIEAERGTIYSEDGQMLSTSIPQFDVFIDFRVAALREKNGQLFRKYVDSVAMSLSKLFKDQTPAQYKYVLQQGYKNSAAYFPLKKKISYREYDQLRNFPLFKMGRYKSGLIIKEKTIRLNPYNMLAFRTIGLARDSNKVGLELTYDSLLKGRNGKQLVRSIAGGVGVPVDDNYMIEPETGKDIVSTIDVFIQDITESALMKMMLKKNAEQGCAIVMETSTGKIKAIANLGKTGPATYWENLNYAVSPTEPGSTFKLVTLLALLEDKKINLNQSVFLENGIWQVAGNFVKDSEDHNENNVTIKKAFELSSNVAMAKLAYAHYSNNPRQLFKHIANLKLDTLTGIDLIGERRPSFHKPGTKLYNATTVPWMSFGYGISISPLQTAMLYNAVANNGAMLKPYLVSSIKEEGLVLNEYGPKVVVPKICTEVTLELLRSCLEGVCTDGTAKEVFKNLPYKVAGKTGTAKVADDNRGYTTNKFQSSFAGYFPADNPQYTCVVVIQNNPSETDYYGATVAAPVFKEISDRLYSTYIKIAKNNQAQIKKKDSSNFQFSGYRTDLAYLSKKLQIPFKDSTKEIDRWSFIQNNNEKYILRRKLMSENAMPILKGLSLKDAVYLCEEKGLIVNVAGRGRVVSQSVLPGQAIAKGQLINLTFN